MAGENINYSQPCLNFSNCSTHYLLVLFFCSQSFPLTYAQISTGPKTQEYP